MLRMVWDFAMWCGHVPTQRNPMELVTIKGASKRTRRPHSLTVKEFQSLMQNLGEPFRTIALVCVCVSDFASANVLRCAGLMLIGSTASYGLSVASCVSESMIQKRSTPNARCPLTVRYWKCSACGSRRPSSQPMRIGFLLHQYSLDACRDRLTA